MDFLIVTTVVTTYYPDGEDGKIRAAVVEKTLESWANYLVYRGEVRLHFADDGSPEEARGVVRFINIPSFFNIRSFSRQDRHGVGASLNAGFKKAFETSPLVLFAVDDWALTQPFDITPWVQLLMEREDVGMVRLGPPHPGTTGVVEAFTSNWQGWGLRLQRTGFAFGHRPALYHKRMIDTYGWFKEDCNALDCELDYATKFCEMRGPSIVLALPHPWQHLESVELAYLDPSDHKT